MLHIFCSQTLPRLSLISSQARSEWSPPQHGSQATSWYHGAGPRPADLQTAVPQLARSHQCLGTDNAFFGTQAERLLSIADCLQRTYHSTARPELRRVLLSKSMQPLQELLQLAAACMKQLTAQLSGTGAPQTVVMGAAVAFCDAMRYALGCALEHLVSVDAPSLNRHLLQVLHRTGDTTQLAFWQDASCCGSGITVELQSVVTLCVTRCRNQVPKQHHPSLNS